MTELLPLEAVSRIAAPVREEVVSALRRAIIAGRLRPGTRLLERELCLALRASRTTVREALRQLEAEGLVETIRGRGVAVRLMDERQLRDIYEAREALEPLAVRLFIERAAPQVQAELEKAFEQLANACEAGDVAAIIEAKFRFDGALFKGSGNELLQKLAAAIGARVAYLRRASLSRPGRPMQSLQEIGQIMAAIRAGDAEAAQTACIFHIRQAAAAAREALRAGGQEADRQLGDELCSPKA
jgi:DNA-binding GntR family transcriptional regulator